MGSGVAIACSMSSGVAKGMYHGQWCSQRRCTVGSGVAIACTLGSSVAKGVDCGQWHSHCPQYTQWHSHCVYCGQWCSQGGVPWAVV